MSSTIKMHIFSQNLNGKNGLTSLSHVNSLIIYSHQHLKYIFFIKYLSDKRTIIPTNQPNILHLQSACLHINQIISVLRLGLPILPKERVSMLLIFYIFHSNSYNTSFVCTKQRKLSLFSPRLQQKFMLTTFG